MEDSVLAVLSRGSISAAPPSSPSFSMSLRLILWLKVCMRLSSLSHYLERFSVASSCRVASAAYSCERGGRITQLHRFSLASNGWLRWAIYL